MQPVHATSDRDLADAIWGERAAKAYRTRDLLDSGAHVVFGADPPIEELDPLAGDPAPPSTARCDEREPWRPEQRIPVADAIACHTAAAAYAVGEERRRGCLLPGLRGRPGRARHRHRRPPGADRAARRVVATMLAGRWVHGRPPW